MAPGRLETVVAGLELLSADELAAKGMDIEDIVSIAVASVDTTSNPQPPEVHQHEQRCPCAGHILA
jgi:hypothetical protein